MDKAVRDPARAGPNKGTPDGHQTRRPCRGRETWPHRRGVVRPVGPLAPTGASLGGPEGVIIPTARRLVRVRVPTGHPRVGPTVAPSRRVQAHRTVGPLGPPPLRAPGPADQGVQSPSANRTRAAAVVSELGGQRIRARRPADSSAAASGSERGGRRIRVTESISARIRGGRRSLRSTHGERWCRGRRYWS